MPRFQTKEAVQVSCLPELDFRRGCFVSLSHALMELLLSLRNFDDLKLRRVLNHSEMLKVFQKKEENI